MASEEIPLSHVGAFVPFPIALLDTEMPALKDTEWRLLCVVVRQTLGWQSGNGRKRRDWMSQKQLMARTGRNSAALSAALEALVQKNLVECCNAQGKPLATPQDRRRHRGRVYFALAQSIFEGVASKATSDSLLQENQALPSDAAPAQMHNGWAKATEVARQRTYPQKSEVRKAKWTKETLKQKKTYKLGRNSSKAISTSTYLSKPES